LSDLEIDGPVTVIEVSKLSRRWNAQKTPL
jgi:hypothetical protein